MGVRESICLIVYFCGVCVVKRKVRLSLIVSSLSVLLTSLLSPFLRHVTDLDKAVNLTDIDVPLTWHHNLKASDQVPVKCKEERDSILLSRRESSVPPWGLVCVTFDTAPENEMNNLNYTLFLTRTIYEDLDVSTRLPDTFQPPLELPRTLRKLLKFKRSLEHYLMKYLVC